MRDQSSDRPPPEQPRSEPEIIPPGGRGGSPWRRNGERGSASRPPFEDAQPRSWRNPSGVFVAIDEEGRARYRRFTPPGPFAITMALIVIGLVGAAILMLALGFVLVLVPIVAIVFAALILSGQARAWWRRLTGGP